MPLPTEEVLHKTNLQKQKRDLIQDENHVHYHDNSKKLSTHYHLTYQIMFLIKILKRISCPCR